MSRAYLEQVEEIRSSRFFSVSRKNNKKAHFQIDNSQLSTKSVGLYWIYTSYSINDLKECKFNFEEDKFNKSAVKIAELAKMHEGLSFIHKEKRDGFILVYNGIADMGTELKKRIHKHFNGGKGDGCLSIRQSSVNDLTRWRVSYVTLQDNDEDADISCKYDDHAENIERMWRLQYGWPLLCKK